MSSVDSIEQYNGKREQHTAYQQLMYPVTGISISITGNKHNRNTGITWNNNTCNMNGDSYDKNRETIYACVTGI